jgi:hypothetical protein
VRHLTLSETELQEVATFWSDYVKRGGEGEQPNLFQYEALNDYRFRDAFLFWQAGGGFPGEGHPASGAFPQARLAYELLGPLPTNPDLVLKSIGQAVGNMDNEDAVAGDTDTATVLGLAYLAWAILLGNWNEAITDMTQVSALNLKYALHELKNNDGRLVIHHRDPIIALSEAIRVLAQLDQSDPELARKGAMDIFSVEECSPTHQYMLAYQQARQAEGAK